MIKSIFAVVGVFATLALVVGLVADVRSVDNTKGGYDYPFAGWSGTTIDFAAMHQTSDGLYQSGYVVDAFFNCNPLYTSHAAADSLCVTPRSTRHLQKNKHKPHKTSHTNLP